MTRSISSLKVSNALSFGRRLAARAYHKWRRRNLVPGWTSFGEQEYFRNYARNCYAGIGEIVDLGCLLGSTTIPLAVGLAQNRRVRNKASRIHAYDLFEWYPWMADPKLGFKRTYAPGEGFLEEFKERIAKYVQEIVVYPGDLMQIG
jgi:hypothetical protein